MAQIASDLENNHTPGRLSMMAISFGFLIEFFSYNYLLKLFIGILIQILIFLSNLVPRAHPLLGGERPWEQG